MRCVSLGSLSTFKLACTDSFNAAKLRNITYNNCNACRFQSIAELYEVPCFPHIYLDTDNASAADIAAVVCKACESIPADLLIIAYRGDEVCIACRGDELCVACSGHELCVAC